MHVIRTAQVLSAQTFQEAAKRGLRQALANIPGMSAEKLRLSLGLESDSIVEAWAGERRPTHVTMWLLWHPGLPAPVRAFLLTMAEDSWSADGTRPALGAEECTNVVNGLIGALMVTSSAGLAGDQRYDAGEARALLAAIARVQAKLTEWAGALEKVANGDRVSGVHEAPVPLHGGRSGR
jgi:hypothetical protein